jgi:nucleotide-binding universal stress UspA family protein
VVPTVGALGGTQAAAGILLPGATRLKLEMESAEAQAYVQAKAADLAAFGADIRWEISRGDPAKVICKAVRRHSADLVVMGTHGRAGTDAFWAGSVAARVVARASASVLLVPLRD